MRKLTLSKQKSMPRTDGNALARLLTENNTCADCDAPLPGPTVVIDVRYGVFICSPCATAHLMLSDALVKVGRAVRQAASCVFVTPHCVPLQDSTDALTGDQLAFLSSMGNARANSCLEARLKQAADMRKPRPDADAHHRSNYAHAKYEALRFCSNRADVPLFGEGITQSRGGGAGSSGSSAPRASVDDIDYDRIVKSGFVLKKKMGKNWKKRFLVLTPQHVGYFEDLESRGEQTHTRCALHVC